MKKIEVKKNLVENFIRQKQVSQLTIKTFAFKEDNYN